MSDSSLPRDVAARMLAAFDALADLYQRGDGMTDAAKKLRRELAAMGVREWCRWSVAHNKGKARAALAEAR